MLEMSSFHEMMPTSLHCVVPLCSLELCLTMSALHRGPPSGGMGFGSGPRGPASGGGMSGGPPRGPPPGAGGPPGYGMPPPGYGAPPGPAPPFYGHMPPQQPVSVLVAHCPLTVQKNKRNGVCSSAAGMGMQYCSEGACQAGADLAVCGDA